MVSLLYNVSSEGNYAKNLHFAGASFFIFGTSTSGSNRVCPRECDLEFKRTNNVAQQQEINELKATLDAMEKESLFETNSEGAAVASLDKTNDLWLNWW